MRLSKVEIARRHLEAAVDLHFGGADFVVIVTLAGAAEEILGNLLRRRKEKNMLGHLVDLSAERGLGLTPQQVANIANRARNALKHANDPSEDEIECDPGEATAMLARATVNYQLLTGELTPKLERFGRWLLEDWVPSNSA